MSMRDAQAAYDAAEPEEPPTCAAIHDGITLRALQSELEDRGIFVDEIRSRRYAEAGPRRTAGRRWEYTAIVSRGSDVGEGFAADLAQAISLAVADYDRQVSRG